jgi:hypothetical protein
VDDRKQYSSSLSIGGTVTWSIFEGVPDDGSDGGGSSIKLNISFPEVDWTFQQSVYGWSALQYQAFARGFITLLGDSSSTVALYTDNVVELAVNNKSFFGGDLYGFHRAPLILNLDPGENKVDLRLIRDVRAMGGTGSNTISIELNVQLFKAVLKVIEGSAVVPDVINGKLASPYASLILCNKADNWINVTGIQNRNVSPSALPMLVNKMLTWKGLPNCQVTQYFPYIACTGSISTHWSLLCLSNRRCC